MQEWINRTGVSYMLHICQWRYFLKKKKKTQIQHVNYSPSFHYEHCFPLHLPLDVTILASGVYTAIFDSLKRKENNPQTSFLLQQCGHIVIMIQYYKNSLHRFGIFLVFKFLFDFLSHCSYPFPYKEWIGSSFLPSVDVQVFQHFLVFFKKKL